MTLIRPRFIALDGSQLGDLARDSQAGDRSRRDAAGDFLSSFAANGCVLLLCWHHFEGLLRHRNRDVVGKRISFFRSLDFVAWIKSAQSGEEILTCTMITCEPNKVMASFTTGCPSFSPNGTGRNGSVKNRRPSKNSRCSSHARMRP